MSRWVAGMDKPHRCPQCWRCSWSYGENWRSTWGERFWRLVKYLPRKCKHCGALTVTTHRSNIYGYRIGEQRKSKR